MSAEKRSLSIVSRVARRFWVMSRKNDRAARRLTLLILAHERNHIKVEKSILRIKYLEITADDFTRKRTWLEVEAANDLPQRFAEAGLRIDAERTHRRRDSDK